jgi:hypothetical protein
MTMKSEEGFSLTTPKPLYFDCHPEDDQMDALTDNGQFNCDRGARSKNYDVESYHPSLRSSNHQNNFSKTTGNPQSGFMSFKNFKAEEINSKSSHQARSRKTDFERENRFVVKPERYEKDVEYLGLYGEEYSDQRDSQSRHPQISGHQSSTYFHNSKQTELEGNKRTSPFKN